MNGYLFEMTTQDVPRGTTKKIFGEKSIRLPVRNQIQYTMSCLDDLLPEEHRARYVWDYVCQLDMSLFNDEIKVVKGLGGPQTADPKIMLALWLLAMLEGIASARHIARLCKEHHAYIWLCGGISINYHSLSDFRVRNPDGFNKLLQESIAMMWKTGVFNPDEVAQDGTRVKANAGFSQYRTEKTLIKYLEEANEFIKSLEDELSKNPSALTRREKSAKTRAINERAERLKNAKNELEAFKAEKIISAKKNHNKLTVDDLSKTRCSISDPECRKMKMGDGGFRLAYNVQFATSTDSKVILGVDVVNTLDPGTLVPMIRQVEENLKEIGCQNPSGWLVDASYANNGDIEQGKQDYPDIVIYSNPTSTKKGIDPLDPRANDTQGMKELRNRMKTDEAQKIYKRRGAAAEFSNAVTKNKGMTEFLVKGLSKVKHMALLYAITHNMMAYFRVT